MDSLKITDVRSVLGDSAFLIDNGKTAVLYDTGFAFTGYAVADRIKAELGDRNLDGILLTHSHYDHALGTPYILRMYPNAKVVASEYAAGIFVKPSAKRLMRELDRKFADKCGVGTYEDIIDELHVDITVNDGDTVKIGDMTFAVVALPGHTRCSVGYCMPEHKLLLGCETLGVLGQDGTVAPAYLIGYKTALDSIKKAKAVGAERILVPHYGVLDSKQTAEYLKNAEINSVNTAEETVAILKNGGTKADAAKAFKDKYYRSNIRDAYPKDAMELNTSIMIDLIERELCGTADE